MEQLPQKQTQPTTGIIRSTISGEIKIRHFKNTVPIEQALEVCMGIVGLRPKHYPSKDEKFNEWQLLIDFIRKGYKNLVAKEIILAFKLGVEGKLDIEQRLVPVYDNFSPEYVTRFLNAYQQYKAKELQTPLNTPLKEIKQTPDQVKTFWNRFLFEPYDKMLSGEPYSFDEYQGADRYQMLEILGVPMSNKEITTKYKNLAGVVKGNGEYKRKKLNKLRRELKSELFKTWLISKAFENEPIREEILNKLK